MANTQKEVRRVRSVATHWARGEEGQLIWVDLTLNMWPTRSPSLPSSPVQTLRTVRVRLGADDMAHLMAHLKIASDRGVSELTTIREGEKWTVILDGEPCD